jgi:hypothetical protein
MLFRTSYEGSSEENGCNLLTVPARDVEWIEAEGLPYAGAHVRPESIMAGVSRRRASEWTAYRANVFSTIGYLLYGVRAEGRISLRAYQRNRVQANPSNSGLRHCARRPAFRAQQ